MKKLLALLAIGLALVACTQPQASNEETAAFAPVRTVLETNCVHCHGDNRLSTMPPINDTHALSKLIGSHWIVPGKPEASRFFQVVIYPDEVPGAMPPSGHAIPAHDIHILKQWIKDGAKVPAHNVKMQPQGPLPRSI